MIATAPASRTAPVMLAAAPTPSAASAAARPGTTSYAVTACPARARQPAIGAPIAPSPSQPTRIREPPAR